LEDVLCSTLLRYNRTSSIDQALLEKLTVPQLAKISPHFMETQPTICPHLQPQWTIHTVSLRYSSISELVFLTTNWTIPSRGK